VLHCAALLTLHCTLLHAVYGLFMQTNAANDRLGSTGTATARAEISMLLQSLQRGRTKHKAAFTMSGMLA